MKKPKQVRISVFLPKRQRTGLRKLQEKHGALPAESIRRAIDAYLKRKGIRVTDDDVAADEKNQKERKQHEATQDEEQS